jgi:predicted RNase H-like HicB family nuclease
VAAPACSSLAHTGDSGIIVLMEVVLMITQEADGGYVAEGLGYDIFTQADTWEELRVNAREAVDGYFFDQTKPDRIRLHLVRDEVLAAA